MKLVVVGAGGRMGQTLIKMITDTDGAVVHGALEQSGSPQMGQDSGLLAGVGANGIPIIDDLEKAVHNADGIVDFTIPAATCSFADIAARNKLVHVIGTTGWNEQDNEKIVQAAQTATIVKSGNMSLGVNLLAVLVEQAAMALDADFDIEILEMHHKHKIDAPSGTALMLGQAAADGRALDLSENSVRSRDGITGARDKGSIGFATLRGGAVIGDHSVMFASEGERLELTHRAQDRSLFASGAVKAAIWAKDKPAGLYSMRDVLGI